MQLQSYGKKSSCNNQVHIAAAHTDDKEMRASCPFCYNYILSEV